MKPVEIECPTGLDRLATWAEVCRAMSVSPQGAIELVGPRGDFREMDSDFNGCVRNLPEDIMWLAIVSEMPDSISN